MRLPWPFTRPQPAASSPAATDVFGAHPSAPQAWRELPVIGTSVGAPPLIAPTPPFRADLAGASPAPIALAPLTHGHGLDAPAGLARGLARPVTAGGAGGTAAPPPAHSPARGRLQRKPATDPGGAINASSDLAADSVESAPIARAAATSFDPTGASTLPTPTADPLVNPRRASVVDHPAPPAHSLLTAAGQSSLPVPPSGRSAPPQAARSTPRVAPVPPSTPKLAAPLVQRAPVSASVTPPRTPEPSRSAPGADRLTLGQSRRMGLGAPIDPVTFRQSRTNPTSDAPPTPGTAFEPALPLAATRASAPVNGVEQAGSVAETTGPALHGNREQSTVIRSSSAASPEPGPAALPAAIRAQPTASALPSAPRPSSSGRTTAGSLPHLSPTRAAVQRAPRAEAEGLMAPRPLIGARPIGAAIQRAPSAGSAGQVRIRRGAEASDLAGALDARAFTHAGEIYLPDNQGPLNGPKAQSLLAHEMTHVAQQRRLGSSLPHEDSPQGQQLEAQAAAAESVGPLRLAVPSSREPAHAPGQSPGSDGVSGSGAAMSDAPETREISGSQRAPRASEAHFTNPDDQFRSQLDSNEAYMFDKFERRLRRVLISERERGGTLIDAL